MPDPKPYPAPGSKTLEEILADLRQPVPERLVKIKKDAPGKPRYLPHTTVRDLLDLYAPGWCATKTVTHAAGRIYVTVRLQITGKDGTLTRDGIGNERDDLGAKDYGDPSSNADAMALSRAAMEFGLFRDGWRK